ncbi:NADPH-dependent F420 reductase [Halorubrum saccharovorum]|uniref:NADPH-dependent F420 reductase n=1 Tax=Halorubrum saccharovorum TaxID=2248 RepID=A0A0F8CL60_9EURY|nr:NADPH-dependent F420 reductase [Halorubrum saccharovorum]KKF39642.1 NADPH-dependent F420 reductase [Halorubrum saccharovorum]
MKIAILGGTGDIGQGLALRLAADTPHTITIGSRDAEKAETKAEEYTTELDSRGLDAEVAGAENEVAAAGAKVVVLAVPPYHIGDTVEAIADALDEGDVLVSPATGMKRDDEGFHYHKPGAGSVTRIAADAAPDGVDVVGAFHNLAAARLANLDADLGIDTLVIGDDEDAKATVTDLAEGIEGLRALDAGGVANAPEIEALTPLLINVAEHNDGLNDLGIQFT